MRYSAFLCSHWHFSYFYLCNLSQVRERVVRDHSEKFEMCSLELEQFLFENM